jgi:hypothetical protein
MNGSKISPIIEGQQLASNPSDHGLANATIEDLEVWWRGYRARVDSSVLDAEQHLGVPVGTISSIPGEPDFIAAMKVYAVIEPILNDLIAARPPGMPVLGLTSGQQFEGYRSFVASLSAAGRGSKLKLAEALGLLAQHQVEFIKAVACVRNRYAHNIKNMPRSLPDILREEQQNNRRIVAHLTWLQITLPSVMEGHCKVLMYYRLADYLAHALNTLRPPPLPDGGLIGALFTPPPSSPDDGPASTGDQD